MREEDVCPASSEVSQVETRGSESTPIAGTIEPEKVQPPDSNKVSSEDESQYPSGLRLTLIILSAFISLFLVSLVSLLSYTEASDSPSNQVSGSHDHQHRNPQDHR